jgi:hypothetical protein
MDNQKETEQVTADFMRHRGAWRDAITECINYEETHGTADRALYWKHELAAYDRALGDPAGSHEWQTVMAMADCMDMVRQELVEAGVIDKDVPPMFVADAVLASLGRTRAAFHSNMVRAYPERSHDEIAAEIDKACGTVANSPEFEGISRSEEVLALHRQLAAEKLRADLAEARATSKSQECIELRERMAARPAIPRTSEQAIAFIGNQFEVREDAEHLDNVRFQLTVHDLLSAFDWWFDDEDRSNSVEFDGIGDGAIYEAVSRRADPAGHAAADAEAQAMLGNWCPECIGQGLDTDPPEPGQDDTCKACGGTGLRKAVTVTEKGPWQVNDWGQGRIVIQSDDFTHDVALEVSGDFGSLLLERAHAEEIARRLNAHPVTVEVVAGELIAAADALIERWHSRDWRAEPTADFIARLTRAVGRAKWDRYLFTCVGKGGRYEFVGVAFGAGTSRNKSVLLYRDVENGTMYFRTPDDFQKRMQRIKEPA